MVGKSHGNYKSGRHVMVVVWLLLHQVVGMLHQDIIVKLGVLMVTPDTHSQSTIHLVMAFAAVKE